MIVRAPRSVGFTTVQNDFIEDDRLSFRAKGVMIFILSKPDHWSISERHLAEQGPDGRSAVATALKELENEGYLQRIRQRRPDGTFDWDSIIYETPQTPAEPAQNGAPESDPGSQRSTMVRKTSHGLTVRGKPSHIVNTDQQYTDQENTEDGAASPPQATPSETDDELPGFWQEPEPSPEPPAAPTPTVKSLTQQPPVAMYRDAFMRYPSRPQMALIMAHGVTDLRRWREVLNLWVGKGWNVQNVAGMLDLYDHPERITERNAPRQTAAAQPRAQQVGDGWDEFVAANTNAQFSPEVIAATDAFIASVLAGAD